MRPGTPMERAPAHNKSVTGSGACGASTATLRLVTSWTGPRFKPSPPGSVTLDTLSESALRVEGMNGHRTVDAPHSEHRNGMSFQRVSVTSLLGWLFLSATGCMGGESSGENSAAVYDSAGIRVVSYRAGWDTISVPVGSGNSGTSFPESLAPGASLGSGRFFSFLWW
jgi:hypothetical protein